MCVVLRVGACAQRVCCTVRVTVVWRVAGAPSDWNGLGEIVFVRDKNRQGKTTATNMEKALVTCSACFPCEKKGREPPQKRHMFSSGFVSARKK